MSSATALKGRYHPDPEINDEVAAEAHAGEALNLAAGSPLSPWECECGAAHARGPLEGGDHHRCLRCGYVGPGGRYMEPAELAAYRERNKPTTKEAATAAPEGAER